MACRTRRSSRGETPPSSLTTRETVLKLTCARAATSRIVGRRPSSAEPKGASDADPGGAAAVVSHIVVEAASTLSTTPRTVANPLQINPRKGL